MSGGKKNLPASVAARLLNRAKQAGDDYQTLLTSFCFERFLYRLGASEVRDRFVLKGAMLLRVWSDQPYRATRDLDLLRRGEGSFEAVRSDIETICSTSVEPDAVEFAADALRVEVIRTNHEHGGTRTVLPTRCGTARLNLQIDIGLGDSVWPEPRRCSYSPLLDFPAPNVLAYARETVIAEKLEVLVILGDRNSRIKDFFDLHYLASHHAFDRAKLAEAIRRTFARRETPISADPPIGLTAAYWGNPSRPAQVRSFARRAGLTVPDDPGESFVGILGDFLLPLLDDARRGEPCAGTWPAGGPWGGPRVKG